MDEQAIPTPKQKEELRKWLSKLGSFTVTEDELKWQSQLDQWVGQQVWQLFWSIIPFTTRQAYDLDTSNYHRTAVLVEAMDRQPEGRFGCSGWDYGWLNRILDTLESTDRYDVGVEICSLLRPCALILGEHQGLIKRPTGSFVNLHQGSFVKLHQTSTSESTLLKELELKDSTECKELKFGEALQSFDLTPNLPFRDPVSLPPTQGVNSTVGLTVSNVESNKLATLTPGKEEKVVTVAPSKDEKVSVPVAVDKVELKLRAHKRVGASTNRETRKPTISKGDAIAMEIDRLMTELPATVMQNTKVVENLLSQLLDQIRSGEYYALMSKKLPKSRNAHVQNVNRLRKFTESCTLMQVLDESFVRTTAIKFTEGRHDRVVGVINFFVKWLTKRGLDNEAAPL